MSSRKPIIAVFGLLFVLPLIVIPGVFNPYENPKFYAAGIGIFILYIAFVGLKAYNRTLTSITLDKLDWLIFIYISVVFIANLFGTDPRTSFWGSMYRHQGYILLLVSAMLYFFIKLTPRTVLESILIRLLPNGFAVLIIILGLIAFYQWTSIHLFQNYTLPHFQGRVAATMGNPNFLAGVCVMFLPFVVMLRNVLYRKWFLEAVFVLMSAILVSTGSRSAWIAVFILILILVWDRLRANIHTKKIFLDGLLLFISAAVILFAVLQTWNMRTSYWDNRVLIWSQAVYAVAERPILGYGQENFELIFPSEYRIKVDNAHNILLETALSSGLVGLAIFLAVLVSALKRSDSVVRTAMIVFLVTALFNPLSIVQILYFWTFLGLASSRMEFKA